MVHQEGLQGLVLGYLSSAILAAGPWLISVATLAILTRWVGGSYSAFSRWVVTINALTLVAAGPFQFALTRYLSDRLYAADIGRHLSAFLTCWCIGSFPPSLLFGLAILCTSLSFGWKCQLIALFALTSSLWMLLLFLGVVRAYRVILLAFLLGNGASALASVLGARNLADSELGALTGYTLGQAGIVAVLMWVLVAEFPLEGLGWDRSSLQALKRFPALTLSGLLYYSGLWADKVVLRGFSTQALSHYEQAAFLAQLTVVPALAVFFLAVETEFYERFRQFFVDIGSGRSLFQIMQSKDRMLTSLTQALTRMALTQAVISFLAILLAPAWMPLEVVATGRTLTLGVYLQTLLYFGTIVLFYFELYAEALWGIALFFCGNLLATALFSAAGWGYVLGSGLGLAANLWMLKRKLPVVEQLIFERQPLQLFTVANNLDGIGKLTWENTGGAS